MCLLCYIEYSIYKFRLNDTKYINNNNNMRYSHTVSRSIVAMLLWLISIDSINIRIHWIYIDKAVMISIQIIFIIPWNACFKRVIFISSNKAKNIIDFDYISSIVFVNGQTLIDSQTSTLFYLFLHIFVKRVCFNEYYLN